MIIKIIKYSSLTLLTIIIIIVGLISYNFNFSNAQAFVDFDFAGWIWSENYGWFSLNSDNCLLLDPLDCFSSGIEYSVKVDSFDEVFGYAWSENVGWVCFGDGAAHEVPGFPGEGDGCYGTPPYSEPLTTKIDDDTGNNTGKITGWANVISLLNDGWLEIGRGDPVGVNFGEACYDCQPTCIDWEIIMVPDPPGPDIPTQGSCIEYSEEEFDSCKTCFTDTKFDNIDYINSDNTEAVVGGSGYICSDTSSGSSNCTKCRKIYSGSASRIVCNTISPGNPNNGSCSSCELYGVNMNIADGSLLGWAWNGVSGGVDGAGWVHFSPVSGGSFIVFPWLQTTYGSIYTPGSVRQRSGVDAKNATYCIFANDININIKTQNCEGGVNGLVGDVEVGFPQSPTGEIYRNALGKIDISGLTTEIMGGRNKYGHLINELDAASWNGPSDDILSGEVYHFTNVNGLSINSNIEFKKGNGINGNGTIIIEGDLFINANITYGAVNPIELSELASVAWIVRGDVIVREDINNIVGAFIVLGDEPSSDCVVSSGSTEYPRYSHGESCGLFSSVDVAGETSENSLTVLGLIIARAFDFGRTFSELLQGSERVIYDGRIIANPPPGLEGFVEGLPVIRDFSY